MAGGSGAPTQLSAVALFWGEDEFLLRLAALDLLASHGLRPREVDATEWRGGETSDLATPSLWGERRALLVTGCQGLPEQGLRELIAYVEAPSPDAVCALTLVSRARTSPPLAKAVHAAGGLARQVAVKRQDLPKWVLDRAATRGVRLAASGAAALVGALGEDPAVLDQGVEQLATAFPGTSVGPDQVRSQFQGLGEQRVWDLCDRALSGRVQEALVILRSLMEAKEDPLLVLGGIASRVRDLVRIRELPERMPAADAAKSAGLRFDWQVRRYRDQARRFSPEDLAGLHERVADTDRAIKGGASAEVVLPALVAVMAGEKAAALDLPPGMGR
jgi:DNA polymerase-3 subunit delta